MMKSSLLGVLVILFSFIAALRANLDNKCQYDVPSEDCACTKYINSSNECVDACPENEFPFDYNNDDDEDSFTKYQKCSTCAKQNLYLSVNQDKCQVTCDENQIKDKKNKVCLDSEEKCSGFVENGVCFHCKVITDRKNKKCLKEESECQGFVNEEKLCITCDDQQIKDNENKKCYDSEEDCSGFVNNEKVCIKCKEGQIADASLKKCYDKEEECSGIILDGQCKYCEKEQITDQKNNKCYQTKEECDGYVDENYCKQCSENEIVDFIQNKCITDKKECTGYIIGNRYCKKDCPSNFFKHKDDSSLCTEECSIIEGSDSTLCNLSCTDTIYQVLDDENEVKQKYCNLLSCPEQTQFLTNESDSLISCSPSCNKNQISDIENKKCYNKLGECKSFISSDRTKCLPQCEENEFTNEEKQDDQTYFVCETCNEIIQVTKLGEKEFTKCVSSCDKDQLIYVYGDDNKNQKCVAASECENKMISYNKKKCSDSCIPPELKFGDECVEKCPLEALRSSDKKECVKECGSEEFVSSNGRSCLKKCSDKQEVEEESSKKCVKCKDQEVFFSFKNSTSTCKQLSSQQHLLDFLENLAEIEKEIHNLDDVVNKISPLIKSHFIENEKFVKDLMVKVSKTDEDRKNIANTISESQQLISKLLKVNNAVGIQKPITIGSSHFNLTAQVNQAGKRFRTKFSYDEVSSGQIASLLEDSDITEEPSFNPYALIVSFMSNNYFCKLGECKNTFPLFSVSSLKSPVSTRALPEQEIQQFEMEYTINSSNKTNLIQCLSYDLNGALSRSNPSIKKDKLTCKFTTSTSLFYDASCLYVNKNFCNNITQDEEKHDETPKEGKDEEIVKEIEDKEEEDEEERDRNKKTSSDSVSNSPTKLFLGLGLIGILLIYFLRKSNSPSETGNSHKHQRARIQYDDDQSIDDLESTRRRFPKEI